MRLAGSLRLARRHLAPGRGLNMVQRRFTVGRANTCDIPIAHDSVSRKHAEIELVGSDRIRVFDLNSANGTVLIRQGREFPVAQEVALMGDTLRFGEVALAARDI